VFPVMPLHGACLVSIGSAAALAIDASAKCLVADVRLAMKRADLSLDWVARTIQVPVPKLSDQNGRAGQLNGAPDRGGAGPLRGAEGSNERHR
jgi:hypothetical protein